MAASLVVLMMSGRAARVRVAIVALYPIDSAHMAGGQRVAVYNLVQALSGFADLDIHVIYCHNDVPEDRVVQQGRATIHYLAQPRRRVVPRYVQSLPRIGRCLAAIGPDVVNAHTSHFAIPALRAGLPVVLTLHGASHREYDIYKRKLYDRLRYGLAMLYDRYTLPRVHDIIAISPYIMREYAGRTQARWHRIDNPLPDAYFELQRDEQPGRLLYAGSITPLKDLLTLLRSLVIVRRSVPTARLRLAGRSTDAAYALEISQFITNNGLQEHVDLLGLLDTPAMLQEYAACSLSVLPSRQEVLPMTVIESMAAGVPVVATRAGGLNDLIEDGVTGRLVDIGDADAMASAIAGLLQNDIERLRLAKQAQAVARERFRATVVAARYRDVFFDVWQAARHR
jgi:glycosyltransferase involved in cell wall biosynthesis